ncbi:hypothetical protein PL81_36915, partial [Streptomyces sp. RSD-27]
MQQAQVARADPVRDCGPDRSADVDGTAVMEDDRSVQHRDQPRQALLQTVGGERDNDGELVAAKPPHDAARARPGGESGGGDGGQDSVPGRVAQRVVDGLAVVLVDQD